MSNPLRDPSASKPLQISGTGGPIDFERIRDLLPALIDSLADGVLVVDRDRKVLAANRRYLETFGTGTADVASRPCSESLRCPEMESSAAGDCPACAVFRLRTPQRFIRTVADASGTLRRWEATFTPVFDHARVVTHVVEVWREITERTQLELQLAQSERLAATGILAAGVAHEINNPLASILAGVESLGRWIERREFDTDGVQEAAETVNTLSREIERCRVTTDKLRLLGRSYEATPTWVDLNAAVSDALSLLRYEIRRREILAVVKLEPELPEIWAREAGMRGVCMNLMLNAVQAMDANGRLEVTTRRAGDQVVLEVQDSGPGIPPQNIDRIWNPFFTTKGSGQGTGLGLPITNRIVDRHGGRISVESVPGRGARFIVELPVQGPGGES